MIELPEKKTVKKGSPTLWVNVPTKLIRFPQKFLDVLTFVAVALDRDLITEEEIAQWLKDRKEARTLLNQLPEQPPKRGRGRPKKIAS